MSTLQEGIERLNAFALPEQTKADVIELVEAAYELGAAEMRERCAKAAEDSAPGFCGNDLDVARYNLATRIAKAIRALPETDGPVGTVIATHRDTPETK